MTDPIAKFAEVIALAPSTDIDDDVLSFQKKRLLDNLATAAAGRDATGLDVLRKRFVRERATGDSALAGRAERTTLLNSVYYNAIAARALDYCDVIYSGQHPSSTDVPVALGVGAYVGASGLDVLAALAYGQDMAARIYSCVDDDDEFFGFDGNILSYFSACAIAGRLLGLKPDQLRHAFGLVLNCAAGTHLSNRDGGLAVRFIQGFASRAGVECALLAQEGVTGPKNVLCGRDGFFDLYARRQPSDASLLTGGLGEKIKGGAEETCFKLYPSCSVTLALTDAALAICAQKTFAADDIEGVSLTISTIQDWLCGAAFSPKPVPEAAALFSVQYVAANALLRKSSRLDHFTREAILSKPVLSLAQSIEVSVAPTNSFDQCRVELYLKSGEKIAADGVNGKGWPVNPLTDSDIDDKLAHCFEFGGYENPHQRSLDVRQTVQGLTDAASVDHVMAHLIP